MSPLFPRSFPGKSLRGTNETGVRGRLCIRSASARQTRASSMATSPQISVMEGDASGSRGMLQSRSSGALECEVAVHILGGVLPELDAFLALSAGSKQWRAAAADTRLWGLWRFQPEAIALQTMRVRLTMRVLFPSNAFSSLSRTASSFRRIARCFKRSKLLSSFPNAESVPCRPLLGADYARWWK